MARYSPIDRTSIDAIVDRWREHSLIGDASFVHPQKAPTCWDTRHIDELYDAFIVNPIEGTDGGGTFASKWRLQLADASAEVRLLAAEMLIIYYLFTSSAGYGKKTERVSETVIDASWDIPDDDHELHNALNSWIGAPGSGYNVSIFKHLAALIDVFRLFKSEDPETRQHLLKDNPWEFFALTEKSEHLTGAMQGIVCHLLYPEYFERIPTVTKKNEILRAFSDVFDEQTYETLDQKLYGLRQTLETYLPDDPVERDFFDSSILSPIWQSSSSQELVVSPLTALQLKKQVIFYGPPGTGKTYRAQKSAESLLRAEALRLWGPKDFFAHEEHLQELINRQVTRLQLHADIGYSEFMVGLQLGDDGRTEYKEGILLELIRQMQAPHDSELAALPHVLILDEINRTDLSRMLGEAFSAMEADKRGTAITLPARDTTGANMVLTIPENLYIIGTMNEIDHSVESLDFALRRRFL